MPKKTAASNKGNSVKVGNISGITGNVNVAGGDINQTINTTNVNAAEIKQAFDQLYSKIDSYNETVPNVKKVVKANVEEIQEQVNHAVEKNEKLEESSLLARFKTIGLMAPDILDVVVATLGNPLAGLGVVVKKIADKAKEA